VVLAIGLVGATGSQAIERGRRAELAYRGPSPVLVFATTVPIVLLAQILVLAPLSRFGLDAGSAVATTISTLVTLLVYVGVIALLVVGTGGLGWREMGLGSWRGRAVPDLAVGAVAAIPVFIATLALALVLSRFLALPPSVLPQATDTGARLANLVSAVILAPIGEELFFRGFVTTAWARSSGPRAAIVRGAILFALVHILSVTGDSFATVSQQAAFAFIVRLPVGLVLGWLFLARRSIYASIGLHAVFNAVIVVLALSV
jgi:membrane protease YdiL (CAAX protease family)